MIRILLTLLMALLSPVVWGADAVLAITHGVSTGDVTPTSVVVWSRANQAATMKVRYQPAAGAGASAREVAGRSQQSTDFTAKVKIEGLAPDTLYRLDVWFESGKKRSDAGTGLFRTAPAADQMRPIRFIWSGDLAGQRYCRREGVGYRIFQPMTGFEPDFFVANGDMIYADNDCPVNAYEPGWLNVPGTFPGVGDPSVDWTNRAAVAEVFNAHWRYNREDLAFQQFLGLVPVYSQWDDHEVINDFGGPWENYPPQSARVGYPNVVAAGRDSFFNYHPIDRDPKDPDRIYRSYRWGQHVELFILDARSYRSRNVERDSAGKTMLGAEQLAWLSKGLVESTATWKIISNDVPLAVPTGSGASEFGRDAFANGAGAGVDPKDIAGSSGFETELLALLRTLDAANVHNIVFVATDVHFPAQLRYDRDFDGDGETLLFHEFVAGPLSAIRSPSPPAFDPTLRPVVLYAEGDVFNYGTVRVSDGSIPTLTTDIRGEDGRIRPGSELVLYPQ